MLHTISQTNEDIISGILNWVCPECGGRMGGHAKEFKCQGECLTDWRNVWERRLAKEARTQSRRGL
jgi:tRNA(Ile2) C34 agmatinyltransferase TiaS